jgi:[protein-PII] uridylyltransferase
VPALRRLLVDCQGQSGRTRLLPDQAGGAGGPPSALQRHPYSLEANCKEGPGGLRDLQLILWIAQAAGYGKCWKDLEQRGFITDEEQRLLETCEAFLRCLRTHLHLHAGRREDRLLFEYQTALAEQLGFAATATRRSSEQLMQQYYRTAKTVTQINAILLQNIGAALFPPPEEPPQPINERFQNAHEFLDVVHEEVFNARPRRPSSRPFCCSSNMPNCRA